MMVAVETISDENISVSDMLSNNSAGARNLHVNKREYQPNLVEQAVDHPEKGDADIVECAVHDAAQLAFGTAPNSRNT